MGFSWLFGAWRTAGYVALSTALIYLSVVVGLRLGERRTLSEMTGFDFAVAVAIGAIIGRTATTPRPSYVQGITATLVLLGMHNTLSWARVRLPMVRHLTDRRPLVLVRDGRVDEHTLRKARLTLGDLVSVVRERGVTDLADVELVVFESPRRSVRHRAPIARPVSCLCSLSTAASILLHSSTRRCGSTRTSLTRRTRGADCPGQLASQERGRAVPVTRRRFLPQRANRRDRARPCRDCR